ncbi:ABC transporter substrate-binding protein [Candidatus Pantoea edessiphila]|uniref:ABC transporter substrate-binding protein n=1 Tax=Candidatus Pantoea edessiphila TaxID=2044610 RepID=A0A2P5SXD9_9GAMM|nr:ABC transporter substrate-binding protein [Pantoea sp. Edef]PPI86995.1 ABC transporter substrate-binding protein [Candidatus Pantoea edessiphila]
MIKFRIILKFIGVFFLIISPNIQAKTLIYCSEGSPEGFNPQLFASNTTYDASSVPIYNRLVEFKKGTIDLEPGLAESWEISPDGKIYTFTLRKGVKWQSTEYFKPTREFNADDVIFTFDRQLNKENKYHKISGGDYKYFKKTGMSRLIKKIKKIDDNKVRFYLNSSEVSFISNLAMDFASILSKEYSEYLLKEGKPEKMDTNPVGTGPFKLVDYQKDVNIIYKANPDYWGVKPKIDNLIFSITPDPSVRYQKIKSGKCHIMSYPKTSDLESMKKDKNINIMKQNRLNVDFIAFNTVKKPLNKVEVRKALSIAINREAILHSIYKNNGEISENIVPSMILGYNKSIKNNEYDPVKAKKMLKQSGLKNGLSINLWTIPEEQKNTSYDINRMADMIKADWAKIGVKTKIVNYKLNEYLKRAQDGEHHAMIMGWNGSNGDPDHLFSSIFNCDLSRESHYNYCYWCYRPFIEKIDLARSTTNIKKRIDFYRHAQMIMNSQTPIFIIAHAQTFEPVNKKVVGYLVDPLGKHHFDSVDLNE